MAVCLTREASAACWGPPTHGDIFPLHSLPFRSKRLFAFSNFYAQFVMGLGLVQRVQGLGG
jgi:hypothetical protein